MFAVNLVIEIKRDCCRHEIFPFALKFSMGNVSHQIPIVSFKKVIKILLKLQLDFCRRKK